MIRFPLAQSASMLFLVFDWINKESLKKIDCVQSGTIWAFTEELIQQKRDGYNREHETKNKTKKLSNSWTMLKYQELPFDVYNI